MVALLFYIAHLQSLNATAGLVTSSYTSSLTCFCGGYNAQAEPVTCPAQFILHNMT